MVEEEEGPKEEGYLKEARRIHRQCLKEEAEEEEGPREGGCLKKSRRTHRQCLKEEAEEGAPKEGEWLKEDKKMKTQATEERCLTKTNGGQSSRPFKRPRMPGMQSSRVVDIGTRVPRRSDEVTGDIGYQPHFEVKWKGKSAITSNRLQQMRGEKRI
ncbi:hypothetical protein H5410_039670 [Solanum commersonii]|uniref:Uncharacterized protein n=1 Tax=Solanum commersonii TaxID=4109 RepID=A0A9J5XP82_SOLCO|nr:hypothetical protein H5410_039670 [Solanum commersonii]